MYVKNTKNSFFCVFIDQNVMKHIKLHEAKLDSNIKESASMQSIKKQLVRIFSFVKKWADLI